MLKPEPRSTGRIAAQVSNGEFLSGAPRGKRPGAIGICAVLSQVSARIPSESCVGLLRQVLPWTRARHVVLQRRDFDMQQRGIRFRKRAHMLRKDGKEMFNYPGR